MKGYKGRAPYKASHPTRVRGLKRLNRINRNTHSKVAPYTGAWIETWLPFDSSNWPAPSHPTRVRGLKLGEQRMLTHGYTSHPTRVRGLKQAWLRPLQSRIPVAPYTGAWIETGVLAR